MDRATRQGDHDTATEVTDGGVNDRCPGTRGALGAAATGGQLPPAGLKRGDDIPRIAGHSQCYCLASGEIAGQEDLTELGEPRSRLADGPALSCSRDLV